jgi:hypothetical protein
VDLNSNGSPGLQMTRQFALSSFQKVSHIGGNLNICNTRLQDLSIFGVLTCVGRAVRHGGSTINSPICSNKDCHTDGQIVLAGNAELVSYNGLQSLRSVTRSIRGVSGAALTDISAVKRLANCTAGVHVPTHVRISVAACPGVVLTTWSQVCSYISSRECPPHPKAPSPPADIPYGQPPPSTLPSLPPIGLLSPVPPYPGLPGIGPPVPQLVPPTPFPTITGPPGIPLPGLMPPFKGPPVPMPTVEMPPWPGQPFVSSPPPATVVPSPLTP